MADPVKSNKQMKKKNVSQPKADKILIHLGDLNQLESYYLHHFILGAS